MNLNPQMKKWIGWCLIVLAIMVAGLLGFNYPVPAAPADLEELLDSYLLGGSGTGAAVESASNFDSLVAADDVIAGDDLIVGDDGAVGGDLSITGSLETLADGSIGAWLKLSAQTAISLTAAGTITPTGTYQPIQSGTAVTTSTSLAVAEGGEAGDLLILRNINAADGITVDGSGGNVECKANVALGPGDTLYLIWNGSDWNCLANYDNG